VIELGHQGDNRKECSSKGGNVEEKEHGSTSTLLGEKREQDGSGLERKVLLRCHSRGTKTVGDGTLVFQLF